MTRRRGRRRWQAQSLPAAFRARAVTLPPGGTRPYDEADWRGALVVVSRGEVELECLGGARRRVARGDVLWLTGLPLRALHARGPGPAVLLAISRRAGEGP